MRESQLYDRVFMRYGAALYGLFEDLRLSLLMKVNAFNWMVLRHTHIFIILNKVWEENEI